MKHLRLLKNYSPILFTVFFISCSSSPKTEAVDLEDVLPSSKKYTEEQAKDSVRVYTEPKHSHDNFTLLDTVLYEQFPELIPVLNLTPDRFFVDRLRPTSKINKTINLDSVAIQFVVWEFTDSIQTENAFFNWLDNFGEDQDALRIAEPFRYKESANYIYVGQQKIVYVYAQEIFDYSPFEQLIETVYGKEWKYCVHQQKGKRAKWLVLPTDVENTNL